VRGRAEALLVLLSVGGSANFLSACRTMSQRFRCHRLRAEMFARVYLRSTTHDCCSEVLVVEEGSLVGNVEGRGIICVRTAPWVFC